MLYAQRFTPTRVGKTIKKRREEQIVTVHPHAGGENKALEDIMSYEVGSPPRGWGKPYGSRKMGLLNRFTPTRVGKTLPSLLSDRTNSVHPHAGGENVTVSGVSGDGARFTPTRVGKTY